MWRSDNGRDFPRAGRAQTQAIGIIEP